jgi:hypothetical protein
MREAIYGHFESIKLDVPFYRFDNLPWHAGFLHHDEDALRHPDVGGNSFGPA